MIRRLQLSEELHSLLKKNGYSENIYYQPPETVSMSYPCIRYNRTNIPAQYADNIRYITKDRYMITVIDPDPDSRIPDILLKHFDMISFEQQYTSENLNHFVLSLYY